MNLLSWLLEMFTRSNDTRSLNIEGMLPESLLDEKSRFSSLFSYPRDTGISPFSLLFPKFIATTKFCKISIDDGIQPSNLFPPRLCSSNCSKLENKSTLFPPKCFPWRIGYSNRFRLTNCSGIEPFSELKPKQTHQLVGREIDLLEIGEFPQFWRNKITQSILG